ncbi:NACHT domain-containing protein [Nostoc sp. LPT]|uniref:NACHT domain-containing protein n=1 Tax=Nostoc sp. LPT TaxID=2815387 RepID=UPI001E199491|nr:NACHT domain-containing protein [Nostoc sp. LPT]MBN4005731.1 NACHT domain-containing protein [Nostoc sp. LPT]
MEGPNPPDNRNINTGGGNYNERIEGDYVQGNAFKSIINIIIGRKDSSESSSSRNRVRQILLKQVSIEVKSRINSSLHNLIYVVLEAEQNPSQVESPWEMDVKVGSKPKVRLKNIEIITIFDQPDIAGRLLILGQPGAGKTTMLLKLAEELIKRANDNLTHPIPVLFSLFTWKKDNQSIKDWLIEQLKDKYGVRKDIGKKWVDNQEIIPLLDGLDEIAAERQELCVRKINDFLHSGWSNPLVVCSRTQEYQHYATLLQLNNSLELCPFTQEQVYQYLHLQNTSNLQLWESINQNEDLKQLARTPFILNVIVISALKISIPIWQQFKSSEERLSYLFDAYIHIMFKRPYKDKKQPKQENTLRWLGWLAHQLIKESATEFLIERIQPDFLNNKFQKHIYNLISWGIIGMLIGGLIFELAFRLIEYLTNGLIIGFIFGLIYGLFHDYIDNLLEKKTKEDNLFHLLKKITMKITIRLISVFMNGVIGLIYGLTNGVIFGLFYGLTNLMGGFSLLLFLLNLGIIIGLMYGIFSALLSIQGMRLIEELIENKLKKIINLKSLNIGLIFGLAYGLIGLIYELFFRQISMLIEVFRAELILENTFLLMITGIIYGLIGMLFASIFGLIGEDIQAVENIKISLKKSFNGVIYGLVYGLISGLFLGFSTGLFLYFILIIDFGKYFWLHNEISLLPVLLGVPMIALVLLFICLSFTITFGLIFGLLAGLFLGLGAGIAFGINTVEIESKTIPNQGIRQSVINTIIISAVTLFVALLIFLFQTITQQNNNLELALTSNLILGLLFGILIAIPRSGTPAIKHFILRVILWSSGYIPWNYAQFLNYCTNRLFLQRVGGGYRFVHDLLRQHFAKTYI